MMKRQYFLEYDPFVTRHQLKERQLYLAAPFFIPEEVREIELLEKVAADTDFTYFSPRLECRYNAKIDEPIVAERAFALNKYHIRCCKLVIAILTHKDMGTSWELGFARGVNRMILGVTSRPDQKVNLMLRQTVDLFTTFEELPSVLKNVGIAIDRGRNVYNALAEFDSNFTGEQE